MHVSHCPMDCMVADFFTKPLQGTSFRKFHNLIVNHDDGICNESCDTCASHPVAQECVGSSDLEVNPEARAMCVSRAGTRMLMTMDLHQEGKPLMEVLQELLLMTHKRTYAQVKWWSVINHPGRSENFSLLAVKCCRESILIYLLVNTRTRECSLPSHPCYLKDTRIGNTLAFVVSTIVVVMIVVSKEQHSVSSS